MADNASAPTLQLAPSKASSISRANKDKTDVDGAGKFKLHTSRVTKHKDRFHALREQYDQVTAKHEDYRRELELANEKLRRIQAENDLLLDAMHIVAHQQPSLVRFLPPPEMEGPVMIDPRGPGHEDFIHERRMRVNGDLDRHFENEAQRPDYSLHETNGHTP